MFGFIGIRQMDVVFKGFLMLSLVLMSNSDLAAQEDIAGCTYPIACNYDPLATVHADVCEYETCAGCTLEEASNYDPLATLDDNSCNLYTTLNCRDFNNDALVNTSDILLFVGNIGSTCDQTVVYDSCESWQPSSDNCMCVYACNFNPEAIVDDGSCEFESCSGCTYGCADNYDPCARNYLSCHFVLVVDPCKYTNPNCEYDINIDGGVDVLDLLLLLSAFGYSC